MIRPKGRAKPIEAIINELACWKVGGSGSAGASLLIGLPKRKNSSGENPPIVASGLFQTFPENA